MTSTRPISCQFQAPHIVLESRPPASSATTRPQFRKAIMHTARCCYVSSASDRFPHWLDEYGRLEAFHRPFLPPTGQKHPLTCPSDAQNTQPMGKATVEAPLRRQNHPASGGIGTAKELNQGKNRAKGKNWIGKTGSGKTKPRKNKNRKESDQTKNWTYGAAQHGGIATNKLRPIPAGTNTGAGRHPQKPAPGRSTPPSQAVNPELPHAGRSKHAWKRRPRHRR